MGQLINLPDCITRESYLFHDGCEATQCQTITVFTGNHGTAQLDDQSSGILELAAVGEDGRTFVSVLKGTLVSLGSL